MAELSKDKASWEIFRSSWEIFRSQWGGDALEGDCDALISPFALWLPGHHMTSTALSEAFP